MAYILKKKIANRKNYGNSRNLDQIDWIVLHYTANDGDTDENNGNYFANNIVQASAHYFVDSNSITQSVPDGLFYTILPMTAIQMKTMVIILPIILYKLLHIIL